MFLNANASTLLDNSVNLSLNNTKTKKKSHERMLELYLDNVNATTSDNFEQFSGVTDGTQSVKTEVSDDNI